MAVKKKSGKKKSAQAVKSTFQMTPLETNPSWFIEERFIHVFCKMKGMEVRRYK